MGKQSQKIILRQMSETIETETVTQTNGVEDKTPKSDTLKGKDEKKSSVAFNAMLSSHMEVEEGNVEPKGSSKVSSSASKIKLLVAGIVFVILIIIIIVLMLPKTPKQNACKYILSASVPKVIFLQEAEFSG